MHFNANISVRNFSGPLWKQLLDDPFALLRNNGYGTVPHDELEANSIGEEYTEARDSMESETKYGTRASAITPRC